MSSHFVVAGEDVLADLYERISERFDLGESQRNAVRSTWLDTFDWRLRKAGRLLRYDEDRDARRLIVTDLAGDELVSYTVTALEWPCRQDALPDGPVRDAVAPHIEPRALLAIARIRRQLTKTRVLDVLGKTICYVVIDRATVVRAPAQLLPVRVSISAVRGYQAEANELTEQMCAVRGLARSDGTRFTDAIAMNGMKGIAPPLHPLPGKSQAQSEIGPGTPVDLAVASALLGWLTAMELTAPGAAADVDIEFLHDLRIAVRRSRSLVKLAGDVLPDSLADRFAPELKWLGDLTSPTRDLDVLLETFESVPDELTPLVEHMAGRREVERRRLRRGLGSARFRTFVSDWRSALEAVVAAPQANAPSTADVAAARIQAMYGNVAKRARAITPSTRGNKLHSLRKRCKELRYALDAFRPVCEPAAYKSVLRQLKDLQDSLGAMQDAHVQAIALQKAADDLLKAGAPAGTLLAMGASLAPLQAADADVHDTILTGLRRFTRPKVRSQIDSLVVRG